MSVELFNLGCDVPAYKLVLMEHEISWSLAVFDLIM